MKATPHLICRCNRLTLLPRMSIIYNTVISEAVT